MAGESEDQRETVERVMHEFKHGDLETSAGRKVTSRRQAVAIGLSEAGVSNTNTPAENRHNRARTRRNAGKGDGTGGQGTDQRTKAELYDLARKKDVPGRSRMSKSELADAIG